MHQTQMKIYKNNGDLWKCALKTRKKSTVECEIDSKLKNENAKNHAEIRSNPKMHDKNQKKSTIILKTF